MNPQDAKHPVSGDERGKMESKTSPKVENIYTEGEIKFFYNILFDHPLAKNGILSKGWSNKML